MDISQAKFRLYNKSPFFGTIIFNLPVIEDKDCPTAGVDGVSLYYNQKYWDSIKDNKKKIGLLAHEVGHLFLNHIYRRGARNEIAIHPKTGQQVSLWNLAVDFAVNLIVFDSLGQEFMPDGALIDRKYVNWSAEKIYEDLMKRIPKMSKQDQQKMMDGSTSDKSKWGKLKGKERQDAQAKMNQISKQAAEAAKAQGKVPSFLDRMFHEIEPKEDWRKVLMEYVQPFQNDYNFSHPDRRYLEEEFYLPDIKDGEKLDWLAIAIDTSGSIGGSELNSFVSEVKAILSAYDKVKVKLTFCDADATPFIELEEFDLSKIKPKGGGGTDFTPVFDLIKKEDSMPQALLYFTDMMGTFPRNKPTHDTLWLSTSGRTIKPPFGKLLEYEV